MILWVTVIIYTFLEVDEMYNFNGNELPKLTKILAWIDFTTRELDWSDPFLWKFGVYLINIFSPVVCFDLKKVGVFFKIHILPCESGYRLT